MRITGHHTETGAQMDQAIEETKQEVANEIKEYLKERQSKRDTEIMQEYLNFSQGEEVTIQKKASKESKGSNEPKELTKFMNENKKEMDKFKNRIDKTFIDNLIRKIPKDSTMPNDLI